MHMRTFKLMKVRMMSGHCFASIFGCQRHSPSSLCASAFDRKLHPFSFQGAKKIDRQASAASPSKLLRRRTPTLHPLYSFWSLFLYSPL